MVIKYNENNVFRVYFLIILVISLIFIIPLNLNTVYAEDNFHDFKALKKTGADGSTTHTNNQESQMCGANAGIGDVKSSLILSIVTLCLPGILEKVYQWNQIKCQEITCMYDAVIYDKDPSFCTKAKSYNVCTLIIGEAFAIPPMAILEYYRKVIAQVLANPEGILWSVAYSYANSELITCSSCPSFVVGSAAIFVGVTNIARAVQDIQDMLKNGFFPPGIKDEEDYCGRIPEIKAEMEKIISATSVNDIRAEVK